MQQSRILVLIMRFIYRALKRIPQSRSSLQRKIMLISIKIKTLLPLLMKGTMEMRVCGFFWYRRKEVCLHSLSKLLLARFTSPSARILALPNGAKFLKIRTLPFCLMHKLWVEDDLITLRSLKTKRNFSLTSTILRAKPDEELCAISQRLDCCKTTWDTVPSIYRSGSWLGVCANLPLFLSLVISDAAHRCELRNYIRLRCCSYGEHNSHD